MSLIKEIHSFLSAEIKAMNEIIIDSLNVDEELIQLVSNHLANAGGKRIRPILTMLTAKMFDYKGGNDIKLASAVEFIHMATLLHDDVVDGSKMRRFLPSANVIWGNKASILVGDFLFSQAFKMIISTKSLESLVILSEASAIIAEGEVSQLSQLESKKIVSEPEYLKIIEAKTAELFGSACAIGSIIAGFEQYTVHLKQFGGHLGTIFQIVDDVMDYFSQSDKVGKNIGDDFFEGKITLPLILLNNKINKEDSLKLNQLIISETRSNDDFLWTKNLMQENNIQNDISLYLKDLEKKAYASLEMITIENKSKEYLKAMVNFAINRTY